MISITPMSPMPPTNSLVYGLVNNSWYFDWDLGTMLFRHLVALFYWHLVCHLLRHFVTTLPWHFVTTLFWHLNWNTGTFLLRNLLTILFRNLIWYLKLLWFNIWFSSDHERIFQQLPHQKLTLKTQNLQISMPNFKSHIDQKRPFKLKKVIFTMVEISKLLASFKFVSKQK